MKNNIDSNFAIAIIALVSACVGFAFWVSTSIGGIESESVRLVIPTGKVLVGADNQGEGVTYRNSKDQYSFIHPLGWEVEELAGTVSVSPGEQLRSDSELYDVVLVSKKEITMNEILGEVRSDIHNLVSIAPYTSGKTLGNQVVTSTAIGINRIVIYFESRNGVHSISYQEGAREQDVIDSVVSSFRFDKEASADLSNLSATGLIFRQDNLMSWEDYKAITEKYPKAPKKPSTYNQDLNGNGYSILKDGEIFIEDIRTIFNYQKGYSTGISGMYLWGESSNKQYLGFMITVIEGTFASPVYVLDTEDIARGFTEIKGVNITGIDGLLSPDLSRVLFTEMRERVPSTDEANNFLEMANVRYLIWMIKRV